MDPELKAKWLAALRSGDYAQTVGRLRRPEGNPEWNQPAGFCCQGVLADVCNPDGWTQRNGVAGWSFNGGGDEAEMAFVALKAEDVPGGPTPEELRRLWKLNDIEGMTFQEIADWIEENVK